MTFVATESGPPLRTARPSPGRGAGAAGRHWRIDNARLYEAERRARTEAEAATRARDAFLATVSHEAAERRSRRSSPGPGCCQKGTLDADKSRHALETIERSALSEAQLIEDLARRLAIKIAGKLPSMLRPVDLVSVIRLGSPSSSPRPTRSTSGCRRSSTRKPVRSQATPSAAAGRVESPLQLPSSSRRRAGASSGAQTAPRARRGRRERHGPGHPAAVPAAHLPALRAGGQLDEPVPTGARARPGHRCATSSSWHGGASTRRVPGAGKGAVFTVKLPACSCRGQRARSKAGTRRAARPPTVTTRPPWTVCVFLVVR